MSCNYIDYPEGFRAHESQLKTDKINGKKIEILAKKAKYVKLTLSFAVQDLELNECIITKHLRNSTEIMGPSEKQIQTEILKQFIHDKETLHQLAILWKYDQNEE